MVRILKGDSKTGLTGPAVSLVQNLRLKHLLSASLIAVPLALGASYPILSGSVFAQEINLEQRDPNAQLLLQADELIYDNDNEVVTALGNVQLDYDGYNVVAERVAYDQKTRRVKAFGNVEILEPNGNRIYAQEIDLTDNFGNGFVNALRVETPDNTRFAAESAQRFDGQKTVFNHGVYTACEPCKDRPEKPPIWQVKAERVILDGKTRTVSYENASFELFGRPIAFLPYFSHADPTVKRKSGFLIPSGGYRDDLGLWYEQSYFLRTGDSHDLTVSLTGYSQQGFLGQAEWRHQLDNGYYTFRAGGIHQIDRSKFDSPPDNVEFNRGYIATSGRFDINPRWAFGWNVLAQSDNTFSRTYRIQDYSGTEITNQVYLRGLSGRNYFDLSAYQYRIQGTNYLEEKEQALVHPVFDYNRISTEGLAGGELSLNVNVTSLSRDNLSADSAATTPLSGDRRTYGIDGRASRASVDAGWKKTYTTGSGLMLTPSLAVRGDATNVNGFAAAASDTIDTGTTTRFMPTAAMEVAYPILARSGGSSHVFEPVAQILLRPDLSYTGILPNEDAQSLVFDTTNLFNHDKFSGYDRIEGGTRANVGLRYSGIFNNGLSLTGVIGQSFHLGGTNPYAQNDIANTGEESGLETDRSDIVASIGAVAHGFSLSTGGRFDENDLDLKRSETKLSYSVQDWTLSSNYTFVEAQPDYGFQEDRKEIGLGASYKFAEHWKAFGAFKYDIDDGIFVSRSAGISYADECFTFSLAFDETDSRITTDEVNRSVFVKLGIRTIGDYSKSLSLNRFEGF